MKIKLLMLVTLYFHLNEASWVEFSFTNGEDRTCPQEAHCLSQDHDDG